MLFSLRKKIYGFVKPFKAGTIFYNLFHYRQLRHNRKAYRQLGIRKPLFWTVRHADFKNIPGEVPWLDQVDGKGKLRAHPKFQSFDSTVQQQLLKFVDEGYFILENFFSEEQVDHINSEIDRMINDHTVDYGFTKNKIMFAFRHSTFLRQIVFDKRMNDLLSFTLGKEIVPFQTLNFITGSEQRPHSDSIHMTTHPPGYLVAAWIALEDISPDSGPLLYYPGSHKLKYIMNEDFNHGGDFLRIGDDANKQYEDCIDQEIRDNHLQKKDFTAKKGDVLFWHANLLHGGNAIKNPSLTRKSMVIHFYAKDVIKYHELSQRPSLVDMD